MSNSIFWHPTKSANLLGGSGTLVMSNSIVRGGASGTSIGTQNPLFLNTSNIKGADGKWFTNDDGFQLSASSPAKSAGLLSAILSDVFDIDADGNITEASPLDLAGNPRPYGAALDLGAYEYFVEPTPITNSNFLTAVNLWFSDENNATETYGHISDWNTSAVTDMANAFKDRATFNEDIGRWDTSSVTRMSNMFWGASVFNQDIGDWNVSSVTSMSQMFRSAANFNQDIGDWNISSVTRTAIMFNYATNFNQDISGWDTSQITSMERMFYGADNFNQSIGDWNVSSVTNLEKMFRDAISFDQDISDWNIASATDMDLMFDGSSALSDAKKGLIHKTFSANQYWPYNWAVYANSPPFDLNSTVSLIIAENQPVGTIVGEFNATDPDVNATLTYFLVSGAGDGNNSLFTLETNGTLKTATTFDYETNASTYSIRVQAKDEYNATVEGNFTVALSDVNDAPNFVIDNKLLANVILSVGIDDPQNTFGN